MANTVGERVRAKLKRQHRNQHDLAREVGISDAYLSQILAGKRSPSLDVARDLEDATGIPARDFAQGAVEQEVA